MLAQSPGHRQEFEVASVKPALPGTTGGSMDGGPLPVGPFNRDNHNPERIVWTGIWLKRVIQVAYDVALDRISGPGWLDTDRFDIRAAVAKDASVADFRLMLQNLLADRFQLALHRETKQVAGYVLTVASGGLKIRESNGDSKPVVIARGRDEASHTGNALMVIDGTGFPAPRPGNPIYGPGAPFEATIAVNGAHRATVLNEPMAKIAAFLGNTAGAPVADQTGLTGIYDLHLEYVPAPSGPPPDDAADIPVPGADLIDSVRTQLGLKLTAGKVPVETVVIDRADRVPTEN